MVNKFLEQLDQLYETVEFGEIEQYLKETLERAALEGEVEGCLSVLNEMMGYYRVAGRYEESILCVEQVLEVMTNIKTISNTVYGTTFLNIATAYRAAQQYQKSEYYYEQAYHFMKEVSGEESYLMASFYNNRSILFAHTERLQEARQDIEKAMKIIKGIPDYEMEEAISYTNLGNICFRMNEMDEGIEYMKQAVDIFESHPSYRDVHYVAALSGLAEAYYHQNHLEASLQYYKKALDEIERTYGKNDSYQIVEQNRFIVYELLKRRETFIKNGKKGLEVSKLYYESYVKPMISKKYSEYEDRIAVGLIGEGSECFGYDDEYSTDHDYGPGVCIWLIEEDYQVIGEQLQEDYQILAEKEFGFIKRNVTQYGKQRVGVFSINVFFKMLTGYESAPNKIEDWYHIPEEALYLVTNGEIFTDPFGAFSERRNAFSQYPEEVRVQKIANVIGKMAQSGQYNYLRMKQRKDVGAMYLTVSTFIESTIEVSYLLERKFRPYYKWQMRGMEKFRLLTHIKEKLEKIMATNITSDTLDKQIEDICDDIRKELSNQSLSFGREKFLELHKQEILAYVTRLKQHKQREEVIDCIIKEEWKQFQQVKNEGGRAECQEDFVTFRIMRKSQFLTWDIEVLESYLADLLYAEKMGRNLLEEKYARMMRDSEPDKYIEMEKHLPMIDEKRTYIQEELIAQEIIWAEQLAHSYPKLRSNGRKIYSKEDRIGDISIETYVRGEISTYSDKTLKLYKKMIQNRIKENRNLEKENLFHMVKEYGYSSIEEAEQALNEWNDGIQGRR